MYCHTTEERGREKYFVDDRIRTLFSSYMHVIATENQPGAGMVFPAIFSNVMGFTLPVGGAVSLPNALLRILEKGGGKVFLDSDVREIGLKNGRASNVILDDSSVIEANYFVASAIDAPTTMNMIGNELLMKVRSSKNLSLFLLMCFFKSSNVNSSFFIYIELRSM